MNTADFITHIFFKYIIMLILDRRVTWDLTFILVDLCASDILSEICWLDYGCMGHS